jgi:predicted DNA binding protein
MMQDIKKHSSVIKVEMCSLNENVIICSVFSKKCVACRSLEASDCYLVSGKIVGDGSVEWRIITGDEGSLELLVNELNENGCEVNLMNVNKLNDCSSY